MRRKMERFIWILVLIGLVAFVAVFNARLTAFQVAGGFGFLLFWLLANRILFGFLGIGRILKWEDKDFNVEERQFVYERSTLKLSECTVLPRLELAQLWYASLEPIKYAFYGFYVLTVGFDVIYTMVVARLGQKVFMNTSAVVLQHLFHGFLIGATVVAFVVFIWDLILVSSMVKRVIEIANKDELKVAGGEE